MAANKSGTTNKKKPTARKAAAGRIAGREKSGTSPRVPGSNKENSQNRFPAETALTGEDRPNRSQGGKQQGREQGIGRRGETRGNETPTKDPKAGRKPSRRKS